MSLKKNFLWNSSFQLVRIITPLVTTPYLARVLGSEGLGAYSYTYAIANYACLFVLLGINQYGNREVAKARLSRAELSRTFSSIFAMQVLWGVAVTLLYLGYALFFAGANRLYSLIWLLWVVAEIFDVSWFFFGLEEFKVMTIRNLLVRVLVILSIFLFVRTADDVWVYCLLQAAAYLISSVVLIPMLKERVDWTRPSFHQIAVHVKPNLTLFAPVIAITLYVQANKLILGWFSGMSEVAFYDNADKISIIPLSVIQSLGTVMLPRMSRVRAMGNPEQARGYFDATIWFGSVMAFGFAFGIVAISPEFVPVFFGSGFGACIVLMPMLAAIIPAVAWSNALGVQWLLPAERDKQYLLSVAVGALVNLSLCVLLVPSMASMGAALATISAEFAVTGVQAFLLRNELPLGTYVREGIPYAVCGALMLLAVRLVAGILPPHAMGLVVEILVGVLAYGFMCGVWLIVRRDKHIGLLIGKRKG